MRTEEQWYDIPEYAGFYQISNELRIKSIYHCSHGMFKKYQHPKILKIQSNGVYPQIVLGFEKLRNKRTHYMHHIVAKTFIPNPNNLPVVMHTDNNKMNYSVENLNWGTAIDNTRDAFATGAIPILMGSKTSGAKINETIALEIFNCNGKGYHLRSKFGVSYTLIYNIKNGNTWNHVTGLPLRRMTKTRL